MGRHGAPAVLEPLTRLTRQSEYLHPSAVQPPEDLSIFGGSSAASQGQAGNGTDTAARAQADYPATPIKLAPTLKPADLHFAADTILANIEGPNRVLYAAAADAPAYDHSAENPSL